MLILSYQRNPKIQIPNSNELYYFGIWCLGFGALCVICKCTQIVLLRTIE